MARRHIYNTLLGHLETNSKPWHICVQGKPDGIKSYKLMIEEYDGNSNGRLGRLVTELFRENSMTKGFDVFCNDLDRLSRTIANVSTQGIKVTDDVKNALIIMGLQEVRSSEAAAIALMVQQDPNMQYEKLKRIVKVRLKDSETGTGGGKEQAYYGSARQGGPCWNWAKEGKCRFGDRCRFQHGGSQKGSGRKTQFNLEDPVQSEESTVVYRGNEESFRTMDL
jgi:hypothetical protein